MLSKEVDLLNGHAGAKVRKSLGAKGLADKTSFSK
jgi:hypothetical protein